MQKPESTSRSGTKRVERVKVPCGTCPVAWRNRTKWTKAPIRCLVRAKNVVRGHYLLGWLQDQGVTYLRLSGRVIVRLAQVKKASCGGVTLTSHKSLLAILTGEKQFVPRPHTTKTRVHKPKVGRKSPLPGKAAPSKQPSGEAKEVAPGGAKELQPTGKQDGSLLPPDCIFRDRTTAIHVRPAEKLDHRFRWESGRYATCWWCGYCQESGVWSDHHESSDSDSG